MLRDDADEPLQRPEYGAMDGDRSLALAVLVDVMQIEALGQHQPVDLDRGRLPFAAEGVGHLYIDLGGIERTVTGLDAVVDARGLERLKHLGLRLTPGLLVAERLVRSRPE